MSSSSDSEDESFYGPRPPPQTTDTTSERVKPSCIGPALPPGFVPQTDDDGDEEDEGPSIGPVLSGQEDDRFKYQGSIVPVKEDAKNKREEWMTVIPDKVEKRLGFTNVTSFSKRPVGQPLPETSTKPKDKELKEALKEYSDKKRQSSLLDMHQETIKKKKVEDKKPSRKPLDFDPEKDLHVRNFDEKQTKSMIEKSKLLNTRFASSGSKFL